MVIRNLRRFCEPQHAHEYPLCSRLIADFERREVLYLAGLFHDIAKGRGGDHSALGARDARRFCRAHGMSDADAELVAWLVEHHLHMSAVAQKQDISDPDVVAAFARQVRDDRHLVALYLFTVADIRGTSPKVWNAWKAQAARGPVPRDARPARRGGRRSDAGGQPAGAPAGGAPPAAPVRDARRCRRPAVVAARQRLLPAPRPPRRSRGTRGICTTASRPPSRWSARGSRAPGRACRCSCTCPTRRRCSPASAGSSAAPACRFSRPRSTRRGTATRWTRSPSTIPPIRTRRTATPSSWSSSS